MTEIRRAKITAQDCTQVANAVAATEMNKQLQYWPIPAEAAVCSGTQQPVNKLFEKFEAANQANFKFRPSDGTHWFITSLYAASNRECCRRRWQRSIRHQSRLNTRPSQFRPRPS